MKLLLGVVLVALVRAGDLRDELESEASVDSTASEKASCWCTKIEDILSSRSREAESQLNYLESTKNAQHYENEALRLEVSQHAADVADYQQALSMGKAIHSDKQKAYEDERAFHEQAISSVRKALGVLPDDSSGQVRGALQGLEDTFTEKMEQAKEQHDNHLQDLLDEKANMLRLAKNASAAKQSRLDQGLADVAQATSSIANYNQQQTADATLNSALQSLCDDLPKQAAEREKLRQNALVVLSQVNAEAAEAAVAASSKLVLVRRTSNLRASGGRQKRLRVAAKTLAQIDSELQEQLGDSSTVESDMMSMLGNVVSTSNHWAGRADVDGRVKTALGDLAAAAQSHAGALPALFSAVRSAGAESLKADQKI